MRRTLPLLLLLLMTLVPPASADPDDPGFSADSDPAGAAEPESAMMVIVTFVQPCATTDVWCLYDRYLFHCPPLNTGSDDQPPYVSAHVHDECMPEVPPDLP